MDYISGGVEPYLYNLNGLGFNSVNEFADRLSGMYDLTIRDANGCEWFTEILLSEPEELTVDLGEDVEIQLGDSLQLVPIINYPFDAIDSFSWDRSGLMDIAPWVKPTEFTTYSIFIESQNGCTAKDEVLIRVRKDRLVYIPNVFSPNNDDQNDYFEIFTGQGVKEIRTLKVFNRWGEVMFERKGFMPGSPDEGWDGTYKGKKLNPAVFIYYAEVEYTDGRIEILKGDVTLIR